MVLFETTPRQRPGLYHVSIRPTSFLKAPRFLKFHLPRRGCKSMENRLAKRARVPRGGPLEASKSYAHSIALRTLRWEIQALISWIAALGPWGTWRSKSRALSVTAFCSNARDCSDNRDSGTSGHDGSTCGISLSDKRMSISWWSNLALVASGAYGGQAF